MDDIIILVDENGEEQEYELLDTVEYEGGRYVVLIQDDDDEVSILQIESEEDEELSLFIRSLRRKILRIMILTTDRPLMRVIFPWPGRLK